MNGRVEDQSLERPAGDMDNDSGIGTLPRFAPPAPQAAAQVETARPDAVEVDVSKQPEGESKAADAGDTVAAGGIEVAHADVALPQEGSNHAASSTAEETPAKGDETPKMPDAEAQTDTAPAVSADLMSALRSVVSEVLNERGEQGGPQVARLTEEELARVAERLNIHAAITPQQAVNSGAGMVPVTNGQRAQLQGVDALTEGAASLVGGVVALTGAAGRGIGRVAQGIASIVPGKDKGAVPEVAAEGGLTAVLPRLSEYRVAQLDKAAQTFAREQDAFWNSSTKLTALRTEMTRVARERGLAMQDVVEKMKPGGDLAELRTKFNEAVSENPDASTRRKAMDKAIESYTRQYARAQEEMLNPEQQSNSHYDGLKARLRTTHEGMEQNAASMPGFANDKGEVEQSHFEKLREAVEKIMEKIKEVAQEFMAMLRGKSGDDHAPAP